MNRVNMYDRRRVSQNLSYYYTAINIVYNMPKLVVYVDCIKTS